jgi:hypothetical protein
VGHHDRAHVLRSKADRPHPRANLFRVDRAENKAPLQPRARSSRRRAQARGGAGDDVLIGNAGDDALLNGEINFDD